MDTFTHGDAEAQGLLPEGYSTQARYLAYWRDQILIDPAQPTQPARLRLDETGAIGHHLQPVYLGEVDGRALYAIDVFGEFEPHPIAPYVFTPVILSAWPHQSALTNAAKQGLDLCQWMREHQDCPCCGSHTTVLIKERARRCCSPDCQHTNAAPYAM